MPNVSASDGWWTFQHVGSLTTTFTQPTSCSTSKDLEIGFMSNGIPWYQYAVQCTSEYDTACLPTVTATTSIDYNTWVGYGSYYSPGLYCPSGWVTVGVAARDENSSLSQSGIMTTTTSEQKDAFDLPQTLLASILEPSQTMALCCPSSMTPGVGGGCHSILPDYKPTEGCAVFQDNSYEYDTSDKVWPDATTTETGDYGTPTATHFSLTTITATASEVFSTLTVFSYMPMITLLHHQSDLKLGAAGTAGSGATSSATPTSNAAGRIGSHASWDGLNTSLGASVLAMALGAAFVFVA